MLLLIAILELHQDHYSTEELRSAPLELCLRRGLLLQNEVLSTARLSFWSDSAVGALS